MEKVIHSAMYVVGDFRIEFYELYDEDTRKSRWELDVYGNETGDLCLTRSYKDVSVANEYLLSALDYFKTL
jgi:hypothetical protein